MPARSDCYEAMNRIGRLFGLVMLAVNAVFAFLFILIAYSPYIHPATHPLEACMGLAFPIFLFINVALLIFWLVVNRRIAIVQFIVLLCCFGPIRIYAPFNLRHNNIPEDAIKLLSYNTMQFNSLLKDDGGSNAILDYLRDSEADIICLQEYGEGVGEHVTGRDINKALKSYCYRDNSKLSDGYNKVAIFSKFPIISKNKIDYESSSNGSMAYELLIDKDTVLLINNHLESNKLTQEDKEMYNEMITERDRETVENGARYLWRKLADASVIRSHQADTIANYIERSGRKYVIVCGDFNDSPISYARRKIATGMNDAFVESGRGLGISYNRNHFYFRIDHILTSRNIKSYNATVDHSIKTSDHYPIWCYLKKTK